MLKGSASTTKGFGWRALPPAEHHVEATARRSHSARSAEGCAPRQPRHDVPLYAYRPRARDTPAATDVSPFGLAWYNGDILTDDTGTGVINAVGRFNIGTFIVSLGAVPSRDVFPAPPAVLAQSKTGAVTNGPVQLYHLGIWFNTPEDAVKAGCPGTATTFTSNHDAGIQVLNTATFPNDEGPLFHIQ